MGKRRAIRFEHRVGPTPEQRRVDAARKLEAQGDWKLADRVRQDSMPLEVSPRRESVQLELPFPSDDEIF